MKIGWELTEKLAGADPGFEKGGGAEGSGVRFPAYLGQFRGLFKEFGTKKGGRASPAPPLWIRAWSAKNMRYKLIWRRV